MGGCHSSEESSKRSTVSPEKVQEGGHGGIMSRYENNNVIPVTPIVSTDTFIGFREDMPVLCLDQFVSRYTGEIMYRWRPACIVYMEGDDSGQVKVHFEGWKDKHDVWLNLKTDMKRFGFAEIMDEKQITEGAPLSEEQLSVMRKYSQTGELASQSLLPVKERITTTWKEFSVGQKVDIQDVFKVKDEDKISKKWRPGEIIAVEGNHITVHYIGWSDKWNEVIDTSVDGQRLKMGGSKIVPRGTSRDSFKREIIGSSPKASKPQQVPKATRRRSLGENNKENKADLNALVSKEITRKKKSSRNENTATSGTNHKASIPPRRGLSRTKSFPPYSNYGDDHQNEELMKLIYQQEEDEYYEALKNEQTFISAMNEKMLHVVEVDGDGNCLFRAVAHQIWLDEDRHVELRRLCVAHMRRHEDRFSAFYDGDFTSYLHKMNKLGEWGDDIEIRALEEITDRLVNIYSSQSSAIEPLRTNFDEINLMYDVLPLKISYHGKNHYNSVYDEMVSLPLHMRESDTLCSTRHKRLMET